MKRFMFAAVCMLAACETSKPLLADLEAACSAGDPNACLARDEMRVRIKKSQEALNGSDIRTDPEKGIYVTGHGPRIRCRQGFESEVNCTRY